MPFDPYGMKKKEAYNATKLLLEPTRDTSTLMLRAGIMLVFLLAFAYVYFSGMDAELQRTFDLDPFKTLR